MNGISQPAFIRQLNAVAGFESAHLYFGRLRLLPKHTMSDSSNKRPVHGVEFINGQPTVVFDTICTKHRQAWLVNVNVHRTLNNVWRASDHWLVGRYVIMPDHIQLFAWATESSGEYENWVNIGNLVSPESTAGPIANGNLTIGMSASEAKKHKKRNGIM